MEYANANIVSPQRLLVYGWSTDKLAIISTVKEFTEDDQQVVNVRFSDLDYRRVAALNGSSTFFMTECFFFTIAVERVRVWIEESFMFSVKCIMEVRRWPP